MYPFFAIGDFNISLSGLKSATRFFKR